MPDVEALGLQEPHQAVHFDVCSAKRQQVPTGAPAGACAVPLLGVIPVAPMVAAVGDDVALYSRAAAGVARGVLCEADVVGDGVLERCVHACGADTLVPCATH